MLERDRERFAFAERQAARLPLGAGALAGVSFDTDRRMVADELGFAEVAPNSIDAVSNRDFVLDYLSAAALCATHLSRLGAELVLWSSEEFGFCELPDAWSAGSSIMPQKKNPDAAELLRAKAPRVVARLTALHGALHALPAHLQQGHAGGQGEPLRRRRHARADAARRARDGRGRALLARAHARRRRRRAARRDRPRRHARRATGCPSARPTASLAGLVRAALEDGRTLSQLTPAELAEHSALLAERSEEYYAALRQDSWLESKVSEGGTALARVREQLRAGARRARRRPARLSDAHPRGRAMPSLASVLRARRPICSRARAMATLGPTSTSGPCSRSPAR